MTPIWLPLALATLFPAFPALPEEEPAVDSSAFATELSPDTSLELEAFWEPCTESTYGLFQKTECLAKIQPAVDKQTYSSRDFETLLPKKVVPVGEIYKVYPESVLPFLRQLHEGAGSHLSMGHVSSVGTYALVRAVGPRYAEIFLRAHAEFAIEKNVLYRPAQFEGRLFIDHTSGEVCSFQLSLPSRNTNVDINVFPEDRANADYSSGRYGADIGWVPRMEVVGGEVPEVEWSRSISVEEARARVRRPFYEFDRIDWMPFEEAVLASKDQERPLHVIVLFGTLDDESC